MGRLAFLDMEDREFSGDSLQEIVTKMRKSSFDFAETNLRYKRKALLRIKTLTPGRAFPLFPTNKQFIDILLQDGWLRKKD